MRVLIVDTCYPAFVDAHYRARPGLERAPYAEQWRALMNTFFGTADSYSHFLGLLGHEAHEVVVDCSPLQAAWASEHPARRRLRVRSIPPGDEVLVRQAEWFEPDVIYVQNLSHVSDRALARLKRISGFLVGQLGTEPPPVSRLRRYDLLLTSFPHFVPRLREAGLDVEYFRIGFDERILDRLSPAGEERYGAVFVGALSGPQWPTATPLLEGVAGRSDVDFWGYGAQGLPPDSPILKRYHGEAWGIDMFRVLRAAKVALNRHGDVAESFANNMRLFEATGVGTMLLTDEKANLHELFESGREVETYAGEAELIDKIEHYLAHDEERAAIARAGQERTLREHSYRHRMQQLAGLLAARLGTRVAAR